jgi:hypothetical protein
MANTDITGKKIFFLYPQTIVQNEVMMDLVMQEYEVYTVRDHLALRRVLKRFPNSIVFANIDEKLSEKEWESWVRGVMSDPATATIGIGILTSTSNDELKHKYLASVKVKCGFTHVSTDLKKLLYQIIEILKAEDAMGRRKYIRATADNEKITTVNFPIDGHFISGNIRDISSTGFSCTFPDDPNLLKNTLITDMQLKLQSTLLRAEGVVFGNRLDEYMKVYVFVFTPRTDPSVCAKIRKYIQSNIQAKMDMELKK